LWVPVGNVKVTVPNWLLVRVMAPSARSVPLPPLALSVIADPPELTVNPATVWLVEPEVLPTRLNVPPPRVNIELEEMLPEVPSPSCSVPPVTVVVPVYELVPLRIRVPLPICDTPPVPLIPVETVYESERLKARVELSVMAPVPSVPVVPPLPI